MEINPTRMSIAELALEVPNALRALEDLKIDFCCHGERTIAAACEDAGIRVEDLFEAVGGELALQTRDWVSEPMAVLEEHLVAGHHVSTRHALDTVMILAARVADRHGENHPEVLRVRDMVTTLRNDLLAHMDVEEAVVFPWLHALESGREERPHGVPAGIGEALRAIAADHEVAAARLAALRQTTADYLLPEDACLSYRALYERLAALEVDLGEHMQLENAFIFSRAAIGGDPMADFG